MHDQRYFRKALSILRFGIAGGVHLAGLNRSEILICQQQRDQRHDPHEEAQNREQFQGFRTVGLNLRNKPGVALITRLLIVIARRRHAVIQRRG